MMTKKTETADTEKLSRDWHPKFIEYTEFIASHSNYGGLFFERRSDNRIKWVVAGKSSEGIKRREWWNKKCLAKGIKIEPGCYSKIALQIHPTKTHTCQICGKELSLEYVYPNARLIDKLSKHFGLTIEPFTKSIFEIIDDLKSKNKFLDIFKNIFNIKHVDLSSKEELKKYIQLEFVDKHSKSYLSPGAMSNSPDRFDGFHSDGACCRHSSDRGRHKSNLQRYGQDRRVYENWSDGDWKMADRLMSCFRANGVSADHIGPISLGFCHRPKFQPLSKEKNSAKNNRMTLKDVKTLIEDELNGQQVISWHSKIIWDRLKNLVKTDHDAIKLSRLMRNNMHHILILFSKIDEIENGREYLKSFLNPGYSLYDHKFSGFDPKTGLYKSHKSIRLDGKNQKNNIDRYYRIAFEKLEEYKTINNRRNNIWKNKKIDSHVLELLNQIKSHEFEGAKTSVENILELLANDAHNIWKSH